MAITWGAAVADATNAFRIGYEFSQSPATVTSGTTSVTVTEKIYLGTKYNAFDSGADWTLSGSIAASGSTAFNHGSGTAWSSSNVTLLATRTRTFAPSFSATTVTSLSATVTGLAAIAGTASVSGSWTTAKRPVGAPAAPTALTATRVSDTQQNLAWTNTSPTSSSNPYVNVVVQRSTDGGAFVTIATLGVVTSYSDKSTSTNHRYSYRVYASNGGGSSAVSAATSQLYTTPRAPSTPTATKNAAGDIVVTWPNANAIASQVEVWHYANGVLDGTALATLTGDPLTYTHAAPSATVTHKYKLRYKVPTPALNGPYSADSNTVALTAAPNAPTIKQPAPGTTALDANDTFTMGWQHNPTDTTPQRKYEVQWRTNGGAWSASTPVTSSAQQGIFSGGTVPNGTTFEFQVRTWGSATTGGADGTGASPWTISPVYLLRDKPSATIGSPTGATYPSSVGTVAWNFFDTGGYSQAAWKLELIDGANIVEVQTGTGTTTTATFSTPLLDTKTYTFRLQVQNDVGLWSAYATWTGAVSYAKPPVPTLTADWDLSTMGVAVAITNPPEAGAEVTTDHNDIYRAIDGGEWVLVASGIGPNSGVIDRLPALAGLNSYKVVAYSALPSSVESAVLQVDPPQAPAMALNAGPGWGLVAVLPYDPEVGFNFETERVLHHFAGRDYAVPYTGEALDEGIEINSSVGSNLPNAPTWEDVKLLCQAGADLACYRDPTGRRMFVSLGAPSFGGVTGRGVVKFGIRADRIDYTEGGLENNGLVLAMGLYLDTDGVPYFDPNVRSIVALDADGQPYVVMGE